MRLSHTLRRRTTSLRPAASAAAPTRTPASGLPARLAGNARGVLRRRGPLAGLLALALALGAQTAGTTPVRIAGLSFGDAIVHEGANLQRRGAGLLTYFFVKAYASALYLPPNVPASAYRSDVPKCLEIAYLVGIDGKDFGPAGEKVLARIHPAARLRALRPQFEALNRAYVDIKEGDRYLLCYAPGKGTTLKYNGRPLVTVPGAEFGSIYYDIWLGPKPVDEDLRDELLGVAS